MTLTCGTVEKDEVRRRIVIRPAVFAHHSFQVLPLRHGPVQGVADGQPSCPPNGQCVRSRGAKVHRSLRWSSELLHQ